MIKIEIEITNVPYEQDMNEIINHIQLILLEEYGLEAEIYVEDFDFVNILNLSNQMGQA